MSLYKALTYLYPQLSIEKDYVLKDDGKGTYIYKWNTTLPKPSENDVLNAINNLTLEETKQKKFVELDRECEATILGRFKAMLDGVEYEFSNDDKAQSRFNGSPYLYSSGITDNIEWTCYLNGQRTSVFLDESKFNIVAKAAFNHQVVNISKFREKISQLETATTIQEVQAITW